jgi:hypothetical protein
MTVSVAWVGAGRQYTANISTETVVVVKYAGAGNPSASAADGALQGSNAVTVPVNKTGVALFIALPSALDFDSTYAGQFVYVWGSFLAPALLNTQAANGMGICMSSGTPTTSNYSLWSFFGNGNYTGGWRRMVIDPTKTRSTGQGTFSTNNVTHIGVFANVGTNTAKFDNLILDCCDVGTGLQITGTSTTGLVSELLTNEATNRYGIVTALNDPQTAAALAGKLTIGYGSGSLSASVTDENSKLFVARPQYYLSGVQPAVPLTYAGIEVLGAGSGTTDITIGQPVSTTSGRNGITLAGNAVYTPTFDRDDGSVDSADFYGTSLENITGTINLDGVHDFNGNTMVSCAGVSIADGSEVKALTSVLSGQINLNSTGKLTNSIIINNTASSNVLATNIDDISGCSFTSDGTGHAIEIDSVGDGTMDWNNDDSGYASTDGSTGNETIYVNIGSGSLDISVILGHTTPTIRTAGATVNVLSGVPVKVTTVKTDGTAVGSAQVHLRAANGTGPFPYQESVTVARSSTTATVDHTGHGMAVGDKFVLRGITDKKEDNTVQQIVTVPTVDSYTYTTSDSGSTSYEGSITSTFVALDGTTNATTGVLSTARVYSSNQPVTGWTRKSTSSPYYIQGILTGEVDSSDGYNVSAVMISDE